MAWHLTRTLNGSCSTACWCNQPDPAGVAVSLSWRDYCWAWKPSAPEVEPNGGGRQ